MEKNIFCDKKVLNNEDSVEKFFLDRLIKKLGYEDIEIKTKTSIKELMIGKGRNKEKYKPDYVIYKKDKPVIVIDAKATREDLDEYIYQVSSYSLLINQNFKNENPIRFSILSNGITTKIYNWDENKPLLTLNFEDFVEKNKNYIK